MALQPQRQILLEVGKSQVRQGLEISRQVFGQKEQVMKGGCEEADFGIALQQFNV